MRSLFSFSLLLLASLLAACSSFSSEDSGYRGVRVLQNSSGEATCAVHGTPIVLAQGYRMARLEPLPRDSAIAALESRNPNFLPPEWSLERSELYRYPGPVEYCPACQRALEHELRQSFEQGVSPSANSGVTPIQVGGSPNASSSSGSNARTTNPGARFAPGVGGGFGR